VSIGQWIGLAVFIGAAGYVIYRVKTLNSAIGGLKRVTKAGESHNELVQKAIDSTNENIAAVRENNALLRELIEINKKLLEKQNEPKH
jgi:hypothetical protein